MPDTQTAAPLDVTDRKILCALQRDPRASVRSLARSSGLSPGTVGERLERLESRGVIRGYRVDIDPAALGLDLDAVIGIELTQHHSVLETMRAVGALPEVTGVDLVTGRWDLLVRMQVRDRHHLKDVLTADVWQLPSIRHSESMIVLESTVADVATIDPSADETPAV